jgi:quercetin dioxygenase-like cupin family protein
MNLKQEISDSDKMVATKNILKEQGSATLIKIKKDGILAKHQSRENALLVLLSGKATYEEDDRSIELTAANDFVQIPGKVTHSVSGKEDALLLLIQ